jgi:LysR family glycine cleavage system transcriptional activator
LNAIRTFEAVGRHGSISGAAKELLVTEPAVSRALKNLEEHFGLALFHRTSSGLKLTEHGKLLLPDVSTALDRIAIASSLVYEQRRYSVSLLATPFIAAHWISKHVKDFLDSNRDISIRIHSSFRYEELERAEFDVAIWNGPGKRKGYVKEHLFSLNRVPICTRAFADANLRGAALDSLANVTLIHEYDYAGWMDWFEAAGLDKNKAARGLVSDNYESILQSTLNGAGVALLFESFLNDEALRADIVAPYDTHIAIDTDYSMFHQAERKDNPAVERFVDFLRGLDTRIRV